ncbi:hypothetical protein Dform_00516 [Dehalogenimonas formicexedens]|uniref:Nucleic acid-binding protein, contains PIN domain n=1 Tax=Dehalogenimonas formicexedens TaxID=1839801 RepID=A0A1P8F5W7_9CHLR|nr:hypothetical protein Dform_00516 [Dehalogenimonas formicexedens]
MVLDTDLLSSFAWVNRADILCAMFSKNMVVPEEVLVELQRIQHIFEKIQKCVSDGHMGTVEFITGSPEATEYFLLVDSGIYGSGEAACMAYLKHHPGTMGSNNLADVFNYCQQNTRRLITTCDILLEACRISFITRATANSIWEGMIRKRRRLPSSTFDGYLALKGIVL